MISSMIQKVFPILLLAGAPTEIALWAGLIVSLAVLLVLARRHMKLYQRVFAGLILGVIYGAIFGADVAQFKIIGDLFVRGIRMLVVPLIFVTLVSGIVAMGDPKKLGSIGLKAMGLYMFTTLLAIVIGLLFGTVFRPGEGVNVSGIPPAELASEAPGIADRLSQIIPINPVSALAEGNVLSIIFFAVLFGIGIISAGKKGEMIGKAFESASEAMLQVAHIVMGFAPYGVFALIAWVAGTQGADTFKSLLTLTLVLYGGCLLHMLFVYGGLIRIGLRLPLVRFFRGIFDAQAVAYSTSSSSATLPVTLTNVEENLGVKPVVASSVLPLGSTINMDGTALYLGIVTLFAAQIFGIEVTMTDYFMIALTATLVSIGAAGIPSASLFLLATVLTVIDVSEAQAAVIVGLILPFDRLLDMARTVLNITGDAAVATAVAKWEGELDEETFRRVASV